MPAAVALEVVLGSDRVVRVPTDFDSATLRQFLVVLEKEQPLISRSLQNHR
jgi:hypothetical protein